MMTKSQTTPDPCPTCGALPCDQVNDPQTTKDVEIIREALKEALVIGIINDFSTDFKEQMAMALRALKRVSP